MLPHLLPKIKGKLSDHEGKLQEAQDLLHSAQGKMKQAGSLAEQNHANLTGLEVQAHIKSHAANMSIQALHTQTQKVRMVTWNSNHGNTWSRVV